MTHVMTPEFHWFIPNSGDGRHLTHTAVRAARSEGRNGRAIGHDYLRLVARAAEQAGFDGAMLTTGAAAEDAFVVAAGLADEVPRLKLMIGFMPGLELPLGFAQKVATLQQLTGGRVLLSTIHGSSVDHRSFGDFAGHDARHARTDELLQIAKAAWRGEPIEHAGAHYLVGCTRIAAAIGPVPPLYMYGASEAAAPGIVRHADVHMLWGETPEMVRERIGGMQARAAQAGRSLRYGLRVQVIARDTEAEAWEEASRLLRDLPQEQVDVAQRQLAQSDSVGQRRMRSLHHGRRPQEVRALEVSPNLWAGVGLVRSGSGTALVGSHAQVAQRIEEYRDLGVSCFVLSGYPNLEEATRVGRGVLPRLRPGAPAGAGTGA